MSLRFLTAGDSHGPALFGILEGLPAHLPIDIEAVNDLLARRQASYGRGERMQIESDRLEILSGLWRGQTTGAPLALRIANRASHPPEALSAQTIPRPGHADLPGAWKFDFLKDFTPLRERASARETAMRTAIGAICEQLLARFDIYVLGHVLQIGSVQAKPPEDPVKALRIVRDRSPFHCVDPHVEEAFRREVDQARESGDTLGGVVEVRAEGLPPGLGSVMHPDRRLDALLGLHLLSIPSAKAVEIGDGIAVSSLRGSAAHDPIHKGPKGLVRPTNRAGGLEGGMTNGQPLVVKIYLKPIPTLRQGLPSVDLITGRETPAPYVRSDVVAVPAAAIVAETVVAFVLAQTFLEKFAGDTLDDIVQSYRHYCGRIGGSFQTS